MRILNTLVLFFFLVSVCQIEAKTLEIQSIHAGKNTSLSRLVKDSQGNIYLSWVETVAAPLTGSTTSTKDEHQKLYYSLLQDGNWGKNQVITEGDNWFVNWADFPSLVVNDNTMTAHWLQMSAEGTYDYDVKATFYDAKTHTWAHDTTVHKDGVSAEHGFVAMLPMEDDQTFITWLDGRFTKTKKEDGSRRGMTLRAGVFDGQGTQVESWQLDDLVCDCCQTNAAISTDGPLVVYRDRTKGEVRDIYIVRFVEGQWTEPKAVSSDNWVIAGCPVNGPDIASKAGKTAVVWFSAKDDKPIVQLILSDDNGQSFGKPLRVASKNTNGRVSVTILDSGKIVVSWLETNSAEAAIQIAIYDANGVKLDSLKVADTKTSRRSGFPVLESTGEQVFITWTDISNEPQVMVAKVMF